MFTKRFLITVLVFCVFWCDISVFALETKYPDYAYEFLGEDRYEKFNRKMFNFNQKLNKYVIRPVHIIWSSIIPEYGMDRINGVANNIEYPIRLVSSLLQRDFTTSKNETIRFFTNTILGFGGMFDPAKHLFHLEQSKENMEQALACCKVKTGAFFVMPVLSFTNIRGLFGKALDMALNPSCYIGSPILALVKLGLTVNKTAYIQPLLQMVESTYADPYDITKKAYGLDSYIKHFNYDRVNLLSLLNIPKEKEIPLTENKDAHKLTNSEKNKDEKENIVTIEVSSEIIPNLLYGGANIDEMANPDYGAENFKLGADIVLNGYNAQSPVIDSMRTALFTVPDVDKSVWNELSIWNRSFRQRLKTSTVDLAPGREPYKYRYLLQKDKKSPLVIIYPSIGEGVMASHSVIFAKLFYDAGYSVLIQGSHFQWEFVNSMPNDYHPGLPAKDAEVVRLVTKKIIDQLEKKYAYQFEDKIIIGTSFGALTSLFVGSKEAEDNILGNTRYISICPPIDLIYAMKQVDKNSEDWNRSSEVLKKNVAEAAAKIVKFYELKDDINFPVNNLPFSDEEAKLITGFLMHQKLSDLVYSIEKTSDFSEKELYNAINDMNFQDYTKKYLLSKENETCEDLSFETGLISISNYLQNNDNYVIYHSLNDYLINKNQLKNLKQIAGNKLIIIDNGSHLGFLYRKEFMENLKNLIGLK